MGYVIGGGEAVDSGGAVDSVNGDTGIVTVDKSGVGLGNVDNTSDSDKPISSATQTALGNKANSSHTHIESDITDLDKYTQSETNNLLDDKVDTDGSKVLSDSNYTTTEKSKLSGIESNAEVNLTDSEVKTAYENNANTNAFTDSEQTKLTGISDGAEVNSVDSVNTQTGAVVLDADYISDTSTTNKFTNATDISKLSNIEANATANPNAFDKVTDDLDDITEGTTNKAFTSTLRNKLNGVEASAEVNPTDAEIKTSVDNELTGNVVGTTDTQTITNKTIDANSNTISNISKSDVGLSNVDNTSDANKPVSSATQSALNDKFDTATDDSDDITEGSANKFLTTEVTDRLARLEYQALNQFVSVWKTNNSGTSSSDQIKLPLISAGTYDFIVDWGDNTIDNITSYNQSEVTHTYPIAGTYTVKISGVCNGFKANENDELKLTEIKNFGCLNISNVYAFRNCVNLQITATDTLDTVGTTSFEWMFQGCTNMTNAPKFTDTSSVTRTDAMFQYCSNLVNVPLFNTSSVTIMHTMFQSCFDLVNVPLFDISSAISMNNFLQYGSLSTENYSSLLEYWDTLTLQDNVTFAGGNSKYNTAGGVARANIISNHNWTITDGGAE